MKPVIIIIVLIFSISCDLFAPIKIQERRIDKGADLSIQIRNKGNTNPFNLVKTNIKWLGKTKSNGKYEKFTTDSYGLRAGMINLSGYIKNHKIIDVRSIIYRHTEGDSIYMVRMKTITYLRDTSLITNDSLFIELCRAILFMENSYNYNKNDLKKIYGTKRND